MWDDATALRGRHTKRKWKTSITLILAAIVVLFAALAAARSYDAAARWKNLFSRFSWEASNAWVAADYTIQAEPVFLGDSIFYIDRGWGTIIAMDGAVRSRTQLESDCVVSSGAWAGCYTSGGNILTLAGDDGFRAITVPTGIDAATVGSLGCFAVITSGSGYLTLTQQYDREGNLVKEIGLTDRAMVFLAFARDSQTLLSCTVSTTGAWVLRLDGEETLEVSLETDMVYELMPWGDGAALWTADGILVYNGAGGLLGQISCETLLDWDCDGLVAVLSYDNGSYHLQTMDETGKIVESEPLQRIPRQVSVCGNTVCVLDSEQLLVYDKQCHLETASPVGASAVSVQADYSGAVLFGDGEFMRLIP